MIKAYLDNNQITLKTTKGTEVSFPAGAGVTGSITPSPYKLFPKSSVKASAMLDKLYASRHLTFSEQMALLSGTNFSVSIEEKDGDSVMAISLKTAEDLMALELLVALKNKKLLKICEHCGAYFFPQGRSDAVYCDRIGVDGFSCKKIGAHRQYRKNSRENDIKALYDKTTKHNRYLKNRGAVSERDYDRWMQTVSESYAAYKNREISEHTLLSRLSEDLTATSRNSRREISDYLL